VIAGLLTLEATLLRRVQDGPPDEYGNPTWEATSEPVACELQQESATEANDAALQVTTWRAYLHPDAADVRGWDGLQLEGVTYELDGDAWTARNPRTGQISHLEARLRRVD
jgi:hypothetical protein